MRSKQRGSALLTAAALTTALPLSRGGHLSRQFANLMRRVGVAARPSLLWSQLRVLEFYLLAESSRVQRDSEYGEDHRVPERQSPAVCRSRWGRATGCLSLCS